MRVKSKIVLVVNLVMRDDNNNDKDREVHLFPKIPDGIVRERKWKIIVVRSVSQDHHLKLRIRDGRKKIIVRRREDNNLDLHLLLPIRDGHVKRRKILI
jgi:hypothetical protein